MNLEYDVHSGWSRSRDSQISCRHPFSSIERDVTGSHTLSMGVPSGAGTTLVSLLASSGVSSALWMSSVHEQM